MPAANQLMGERGERLAEAWLVARGWTVLDRRFRSGHRDIDLVVGRTEGERGAECRTVVFVEVKARTSPAYGGPLAAVHWRKQREMARAAREWIAKHRLSGDGYRFDVIGIVYGQGNPEVVHVENAFVVR